LKKKSIKLGNSLAMRGKNFDENFIECAKTDRST
jgi:hypothetical protein